jgi:uncharacterized protein
MMPFTTIFEGTGTGVAESTSSLPVFPVAPRIVPTGETASASGTESEMSTGGRLEVGAGAWIECDEQSGVVEIHDPRLFRRGRETFCQEMAQSAIEKCQARRVEISLASSMCRLEFAPGAFDRAELGRRVAEAIKAATPLVCDGSAAARKTRAIWTTLSAIATDAWISLWDTLEDHSRREVPPDAATHENQSAEAGTGAPRLVDFALTGGSLTMAFAGAVLPGIPSLPFLLLATRHAIRLAPNLDRFLKSRPWSAAILRRVEASGGLLRLDRRSLMEVLPLVALTAAVLVFVHPPLPVVLGLEVAVMAFACLREMGLMDGRASIINV